MNNLLLKTFLCLFLGLSSIWFLSCDIIDPDNYSIASLDSKINFRVIESYEQYGMVSIPELYLEMQTEKEYPCCNYSIKSNIDIKKKSIVVDIIGIYKPNICLTAFGPATSRIKLDKPSGVYEIKIKNRKFLDSYNLLIGDSIIVVEGRETQNTKSLVSFLWRYPEKSFVYLCGSTNSDAYICDEFIDTLKSVIEITEFSFPDFAEIPYPKSTQGYQHNTSARYFYYKNEEDFDQIAEVMKTYLQNHLPEGGANLSVTNWMNKSIYSWILLGR